MSEKHSMHFIIKGAIISAILFISNAGFTQNAKVVVGGNSTARDTLKANVISGLSLKITGSTTPATFDSVKVTGLSGTGNRTLIVGSDGNLKVGNPVPLSGPWNDFGNTLTGTPTNPLEWFGSINTFDIIFKTDNTERMRITSTGDHPGNVGIGTIAPEKKLHVVTTHTTCINCPSATHEGIRLEEQTTYTDAQSPPPSVWDLQPLGSGFAIKKPNENPKIFISDAGNIGIGTTGPTNKLEVLGTGKFTGDLHMIADAFVTGSVGIGTTTPSEKLQVNSGNVLIKGTNNFQADGDEAVLYLGDNNHFVKSVFGADGGLMFGTFQAPQAFILMQGNGSLGIGLSGMSQAQRTATLNEYKLAVLGKVVAQEYVAKLSGAWPDYVFNKNYKLKDLEELEKFVKAENHLPGIPNAKEMEKNGVSLSEMSKLQMEKIEELTLYMIQVNKSVNQMNKEIENLKAENAKLKNAVTK
ncbi:MAG: hypothetical protein EPN85_11085 [Bacteroidetes bacterium]|nr:MAG: hypothetical protein EPN85_11085 [Bacteroidota bacterium]